MFSPRIKLTVQTIAVGLGFALSAGWDWIPCMHAIWIGDFLNALGESPLEHYNILAWFVWFRLLMLVAAGVIMERLFLLFQIRRSGPLRNPHIIRRCAFSGPILFSPDIDERLHLAMPAFLMQMLGVLFIWMIVRLYPQNLLANFISPALGIVSAIFGLLWTYMLILLPGIYVCIAYALTLLFCCGLVELFHSIPPDQLLAARLISLLIPIPLIFFALPPSDEIKERLILYRKQRMFRGSARPFLLRKWLKRGLPISDGIKNRYFTVGVIIFGLLLGTTYMLEFVFGSYPIEMKTIAARELPRTSFLLGGQLAGVLLAIICILCAHPRSILSPVLSLLILGAGGLLTSLSGSDSAVFILYMGAGGCAASALYLMHKMSRSVIRVYALITWGLVLFTFFGVMFGHTFWDLATRAHTSGTVYQAIFLQMLALLTLLIILIIYLSRDDLLRLLHVHPLAEESPPSQPDELVVPNVHPPVAEKNTGLTQREQEVVELVQAGMKNLEISLHLNISEATLRVHLRRIYRKLNIQGRNTLRDLPPLSRELSEKGPPRDSL